MASLLVSIGDLNNGSNDSPSKDLPLREIPGSYGLPILGAVKDRWDFFYIQGRDQFFSTRAKKYKSTVFRTNMPPGPFISSDSRVIVLLDSKTFPILFDTSKVEKLNVFTGTYMPSTSFTGGYRVCSYLDPTEPKHNILKSLLLSTLASKHNDIYPMYHSSLKSLFVGLEDQMKNKGRAEFGPLISEASLEIFFKIFCDGKSPLDTKLGSNGPSLIKKWIIPQIAPIQTLGLPKFLDPIEDLIIHTFRLPSFLVKSDYKKLYDAFSSSGSSFLDNAESLGLSREEACHNLIFFASFNASFGVANWLPSLMKWVASAGETLHQKLAKEIRNAVKSSIVESSGRGGGDFITMNAINNMELTKSVVLEGLRIEPPVPYQYGKAKDDLTIQSHDATFKIKKGEMIFGFQPFATNDPKVFNDPHKFIGDRFVGDEGKKLMKYVYWSNGRETDAPTADNKQCAGKNVVELLSIISLAEFFLRYDTFTVDSANIKPGELTILSLKKASTTI